MGILNFLFKGSQTSYETHHTIKDGEEYHHQNFSERNNNHKPRVMITDEFPNYEYVQKVKNEIDEFEQEVKYVQGSKFPGPKYSKIYH